jgi:hypothetical protein
MARFFFDLEEINSINYINNFKPSRVFFKYVNRDFLLLLYQIAYEGSKSREFRKIETLNQISIIERTIGSLDNSVYVGLYSLVNALVRNLLLVKGGPKMTVQNIGSMFKLIEYSSRVNEIYINQDK